MDELYESLYGSNITLSNEFLNEYLPDTNAIYIKVFLFYLWKGIREKYTISDVSSEIDLSEEEIEKALKFWIKKKIIKKESLQDFKEQDKVKEKSENLVDFQTKKNELIMKNRKEYSEIEKNILFVAEKILGQTLSERQQNLIAKCYNEYGFEECLIHFLLEYCSNLSKTEAGYMAAVASSWYEQGIRTKDEAKKYTENFKNHSNYKIKGAKKNAPIKLDRDDYERMLIDSINKGKFK